MRTFILLMNMCLNTLLFSEDIIGKWAKLYCADLNSIKYFYSSYNEYNVKSFADEIFSIIGKESFYKNYKYYYDVWNFEKNGNFYFSNIIIEKLKLSSSGYSGKYTYETNVISIFIEKADTNINKKYLKVWVPLSDYNFNTSNYTRIK